MSSVIWRYQYNFTCLLNPTALPSTGSHMQHMYKRPITKWYTRKHDMTVLKETDKVWNFEIKP